MGDDATDPRQTRAGTDTHLGDRELCDACPENDDGLAVDPSIYRPFWKDARAELKRRDYAKVLATVGGITAVGSLVAPVAGLTRVFDTKYRGPVYEDGIPLVDDAGERIAEDRIAPGEQLTVFPSRVRGSRTPRRCSCASRSRRTATRLRDEYTVGGYAAFSKVCTHAGCMVADRDGDVLVCPCHSGRFDPVTGGQVVGGPAPRALPQLPITLSGDGYLVATGDFQGPIGPGGE